MQYRKQTSLRKRRWETGSASGESDGRRSGPCGAGSGSLWLPEWIGRCECPWLRPFEFKSGNFVIKTCAVNGRSVETRLSRPRFSHDPETHELRSGTPKAPLRLASEFSEIRFVGLRNRI